VKGLKYPVLLVLVVLFSFSCVAFAEHVFNWHKVNYIGHEIRVFRCYDQQACGEACYNDEGCRVASWHGPKAGGDWANKCVLRDSTAGGRQTGKRDIWSWVK